MQIESTIPHAKQSLPNVGKKVYDRKNNPTIPHTAQSAVIGENGLPRRCAPRNDVYDLKCCEESTILK